MPLVAYAADDVVLTSNEHDLRLGDAVDRVPDRGRWGVGSHLLVGSSGLESGIVVLLGLG